MCTNVSDQRVVGMLKEAEDELHHAIKVWSFLNDGHTWAKSWSGSGGKVIGQGRSQEQGIHYRPGTQRAVLPDQCILS